ncbi:MAG TPA: biotin carboxylase N-terminal domain-containing protein [Candidatus Limnocylindria bacterium]|nr:biotin carboxylase N-terminal domain-containing protein [Candidatus Limnocylindria bacterium]
MRKDTGAQPGPIRTVLVANRGEIAVRIIRACREMGIASAAVYSDADRLAPHVIAADAAYRIGPAPASQSYLNIEAVLAAAKRAGADAIHPGYGFLSENAQFSRAAQDAGLIWIGPPSATQEALGDKLAARRAAGEAGVPVVPGLQVALQDDDLGAATAVGFPAMLKAAAGGGGRGMRRVEEAGELPAAMAAARREATSAFGDGTLYLERLIAPARHIEVQLLGDRGGALACLGERDCSVQRRHQKLVEETPSPAVTPEIREALFESARRVAGTVEFHNAATVEFLLDPEGNHYFLEMNTRLQVEHGVTELVTGLDLVAWQILIAGGASLDRSVLEATPRGQAIEVRVYAEDPYAGFAPVTGSVSCWRPSDGPGVRIDHALVEGVPLAVEYDPLLAKLMVHAADRPAAVRRLRRALDETLVGGLQTDLGFHRWLVEQPEFISGDYHTGLIPQRWAEGPEPSADEAALVALAAAEARRSSAGAMTPPPAARAGEGEWARRARQGALRQ